MSQTLRIIIINSIRKIGDFQPMDQRKLKFVITRIEQFKHSTKPRKILNTRRENAKSIDTLIITTGTNKTKIKE